LWLLLLAVANGGVVNEIDFKVVHIVVVFHPSIGIDTRLTAFVCCFQKCRFMRTMIRRAPAIQCKLCSMYLSVDHVCVHVGLDLKVCVHVYVCLVLGMVLILEGIASLVQAHVSFLISALLFLSFRFLL
jgi:hypothetical protein